MVTLLMTLSALTSQITPILRFGFYICEMGEAIVLKLCKQVGHTKY